MSLKPGIGSTFYDQYSEDLHQPDTARLIDGSSQKVPRFYMLKLQESDKLRHDKIILNRFKHRNAEDNTWQRLAAREKYAQAETDFYTKRTL